MNEPKGPNAGAVVAAIFVGLFGLCITLVGGGCTILFIGSMATEPASYSTGMTPLFLISLVTLAAGLSLLWLAFKLVTGGFNK